MTHDELKMARLRLGLTQGELAAKLGMSLEHVGRLERGEHPIQKRHAMAIELLAERAKKTAAAE